MMGAYSASQCAASVHARAFACVQDARGVRTSSAADAAVWGKTLRDGDGLTRPGKAESFWGWDRGGTPPLVTPVGRG